jgi:copper chaperone
MKKELHFKTSINCGGCVAKVTPLLDNAPGVDSWSVDTVNPDKILSVTVDGVDENVVIDTVKKAGFKIELV